MKRLGRVLPYVLLGSMFIGCGGGLEEGTPKDLVPGQTAEAKAYAEQNLKNMTSLKYGKPKNLPSATTPTGKAP